MNESKLNTLSNKLYATQLEKDESFQEWINLLEDPRKQLLAEIMWYDIGITNICQLEQGLQNFSRKRGRYVLYSGHNKTVDIFTANQLKKIAKGILSGEDNLDRVCIFDADRDGKVINLTDIFELTAK